MLRVLPILALALTASLACTSDDASCMTVRDCEGTEVCINGLCLEPGEDDAGRDAGSEEDAFTGRDAPAIDAGTDAPTSCPPGTVDLDGNPDNGCECSIEAEACNGLDDDCDGGVDEALDGGPCASDAPGACGMGTTLCREGAETCTAGTPRVETCDSVDEDCDGRVDEDSLCEDCRRVAELDGVRYSVCEGRALREEASAICTALGGSLPLIDNATTHDAVDTFVDMELGGIAWWVGVRVNAAGDWAYDDGTPAYPSDPGAYDGWDVPPDGGSHECVTSEEGRGWRDVLCDRPYNVVCQH